jgi:lactoylglutathione lyase
MKIEHLAIWVNDLELMKRFYVTYFGMLCNEKYTNARKQFESYFLSFDEGAARIELMRRPGILPNTGHNNAAIGLAHFAMALSSSEEVNILTERLRADGYTIASEPRTTGDGYYESAVLDPEGNYVEITV